MTERKWNLDREDEADDTGAGEEEEEVVLLRGPEVLSGPAARARCLTLALSAGVNKSFGATNSRTIGLERPRLGPLEEDFDSKGSLVS